MAAGKSSRVNRKYKTKYDPALELDFFILLTILILLGNIRYNITYALDTVTAISGPGNRRQVP